MTDLALAPATELVALYRQKKVSPVEATEAALARIDTHNGNYNAFRIVDHEGALAAAKESEARWSKGEPAGPVDGVPATVKDLLLTKGWSTLRGSKTVDPDQPWEDDAPAVARLRESGAVLLGKTTTPEWGWKGVTDSPLTGITRNPWNSDKTPGGSSGGAAAACAMGMGALHLGTDGGGSIRIPCGFTGVFGIKGTFGRVPAWPSSPFGTLANVGPIARTVADTALMLNVITRPDRRDWLALPHVEEDFLAGLDGGVKGLRIGYAPTLSDKPVDQMVAALVDEAVQWFDEAGAEVEPAEVPFPDMMETFMVHWFGIASTVFGQLPEDKIALMDPGLQDVIRIGERYEFKDFVGADMARRDAGEKLNAFFRDYDLLMLPTLPIPAFEVGRNTPVSNDPTEDWIDWTPFSYPFNLSRNPACNLPCGLATGLPVGLQIVGDHMNDATVLRAAAAYEDANPIPLPPAARE